MIEMAKLNMTLPKEFMKFFYSRQGKWTNDDIQKCKEYLEPCHPDARDSGGYKQTALLYGVPIEIVKWQIERGADVNIGNTYGTPLFEYAGLGKYEICKLLIKHGADVNIKAYDGTTALFSAASRGYYEIVNLLLEHGADPCIRTKDNNWTSLIRMLAIRTDEMPAIHIAKTAEVLIKARRERGGIPDEEWKLAQEYVAKIGHNYNLNIDDFPCDTEEKRRSYGEAMQMFYELFDVEPVKRIIKHNGKEPITVDETLSVEKQHEVLWDYLVPRSGACKNVQGEVIRISGRIDNEINGNGAANWDNAYKKMLLALPDYLRQGKPLGNDDMQKAQDSINLLISCNGYGHWDEPDKLCALAVKWVKQNPTPIALKKVNYRR